MSLALFADFHQPLSGPLSGAGGPAATRRHTGTGSDRDGFAGPYRARPERADAGSDTAQTRRPGGDRDDRDSVQGFKLALGRQTRTKLNIVEIDNAAY